MIEAERFKTRPDSRLPAEMLNAYFRDGFLILEDFAAPEACDLLNERVDELIARFDPETMRTAFAATDQKAAAEAQFRDSADKMSFFFEDGAFDATGSLVKDKRRALRRIGHAVHDLDDLFDDFSRDPSLKVVADELGLADPVLVGSTIELRQPMSPQDPDLHQDAGLFNTDPVSATAFWFALDDIDRNSGCLVALTGEHRGLLRDRTRWVGDKVVTARINERPLNYAKAAPLEARKGTLILLHGMLPYFTAANHDSRVRRSYSLNLVDRVARWAPDNWMRRPPELPLHGFD